MLDQYDRKIDYIRLSLTDRCNFRCNYCMPRKGVHWLDKEDILSYDDLYKFSQAMALLGVKSIKLTGGEPLMRKGLAGFVKRLKAINGIEEVTITTNGSLLYDQAEDLIGSGIDRINISLDTMDEEKFHRLTRTGQLEDVLKGIDKVLDLGFDKLKINTVPIKPIDEKDLLDIVDLAKDRPIDIRFIQLMPIGKGRDFDGYSSDGIKAMVDKKYGPSKVYEKKLGNGPARYFSYEKLEGRIGFINAIDHKFCSSCNRVRLSPTGFLKLCLHYDLGEDIKDLIRDLDPEDLSRALEEIVYKKPLMHHMEDEEINALTNTMNEIGG